MGVSRSLQAQKFSLRKELLARLAELSREERAEHSQKILERLFRHPRFREAECLLCYVALPTEVETRPVFDESWESGKKVYAPRVDRGRRKIWMIEVNNWGELKEGSWGIREPRFSREKLGRPEDLDLVVVPGLGFDRLGGRLGRGGGYFDRFLKQAKLAYKIGLAFKCQIVDKIPRSTHDLLVNEVLIG